ncbi:MAG: hypothetical protein KA928_01180 [Longilinea sp.]|nr:hypothetical protein [Longilinea sp.]
MENRVNPIRVGIESQASRNTAYILSEFVQRTGFGLHDVVGVLLCLDINL